MQSSNVYLIGPMGAGKTTVGKTLAKLCEREFVDTDRLIESRTGVSISHIFEVEGEEGFRRRETQILQELVDSTGYIVATGGGIVLAEANRKILKAQRDVIFLDASLGVIWRRVKNSTTRPLLQTANPRATIATILAERLPLYQESAQHTITVGSRNSNQVARLIQDRIETAK